MSEALELAGALIRRASVTPDDAGCQDILIEQLEPLGFRTEHFHFARVRNIWLRRGERPPLFVFLGHSDVVPPGPESAWHSPPFEPRVRDGRLYGRGAADMKSSLAAMAVACRRFIGRH